MESIRRNTRTKSFDTKSLPKDERPLDRLKKYGPESLSLQELLAIILWKVEGKNIWSVIKDLMEKFDKDLLKLSSASFESLKRIIGDEIKAAQLKACFELAKRIMYYKSKTEYIKSPRDIFNMLHPFMRDLKQEEVRVVCLDKNKKLIKIERISIGSSDLSILHPKDVFRTALNNGAYYIILVHNHTSGNPEPSAEDIEITRKIKELGDVLEIFLLDHIIIGKDSYVSFKERNLI